MANIASLYTGLSAMSAQRRVLDVVGHNIANQATPGYHRQRVDLQANNAAGTNALFAGQGDGPYGVKASGMTRSIDELLAARSVRETASLADATVMSQTLSRIEGAFPEPTDLGIAEQLAEFWSSWSDTANQPGGLAARGQLLERAATLVGSINRTATDLASVVDQSQARLQMISTDANDLARQIAALNATITANPTAAFDLLDQRGLLVEQLSSLTGGVARQAPGGQIDVYLGGRALVSGANVQAIHSVAGGLQWSVDGQPAEVTSGEASALIDVVNDVVPRHTAALDAVVGKLVDRVNSLHVTGSLQDGTNPGFTFFDPAGLTAASLALSADVVGQPGNVAAGAPGVGGLDGDIARQIALLADAPDGPDDEYRALISSLAVETRAALRRSDIQTEVADAARNDADAVGAVSIDEEMVSLVTAQRGFEAAARFMTVVDELLATLIQRTGVVGR